MTNLQHIGRSYGQRYRKNGASGRQQRRYRGHKAGPVKPRTGIGTIRIRKTADPGRDKTAAVPDLKKRTGFLSKVAGLFTRKQAGR